jgi:hypothetical protein
MLVRLESSITAEDLNVLFFYPTQPFAAAPTNDCCGDAMPLV